MTGGGIGMIAINRLLAERFSRLRESRESGVALMSVMLFMILLSGMSLVLLAIILGQIGPSYAAQKGTKTVYAAQAGLQAALGVIRNIGLAPNASGIVYGNLAKLPCSVTGSVDGENPSITYAAAVTYYSEDPTDKGDAWINNTANQIACSPSTGVAKQPSFAYVVSRGTGTATAALSAAEGNRSIAAVYKFRVTRVNVPGGRIYDGGRTNCAQAQSVTGTSAVGIGSKVLFVAAASCTVDSTQLWVHDSSYQIKLASTLVAGAVPLCVTGTSGDVTLQKCEPTTATDTMRYNQLWSWTGATTWSGQNNPISAGASGVKLGISSSSYLTAGGGTALAPDAAVGAGAASKATNQIVNYSEFGRCLDVTDEDRFKYFMMVYPCKQDPTGTGTGLLWNHKWYYTEPVSGASAKQPIYVNYLDNAADRYCFKTPAAGVTGYPTLTGSCNALSEDQQWTRYNQMSTYDASYVIVDRYNRCLTAEITDLYSSKYSRVTVRACDGSAAQKWNAPPSSNDAEFGGFKELG